MVFSTPLFLFVYLSLTLLLYYAVPLKGRNLALLAVSLFFYAWGERIYVVIMVASTLIDYTHGMLVERCKARGNDRGARWAVASSVFFNLALLGFFKYWDFLAASFQAVGLNFMPVLNVHLPIGISFYTFQTMSYTIDVYRGDARAQRSLVNFGTFVTLFPQLIAGPIIKYKDLGDQIDSRTCTVEKFASGLSLIHISLMRTIPGMVVMSPSDDVEAQAMVKAAYEQEGPVYMRFGRSAVPVFHEEDGFTFQIGKGEVLMDGSDVAIIATGLLSYEALEAGKALKEAGISARIINMATIKPLDEELVLKAAQECGKIITCEEHSVIGGLGEAVCALLSEKCPTLVRRIGVNDEFGHSGPAADLLKQFGLSAEHIVEVAKDFCGK